MSHPTYSRTTVRLRLATGAAALLQILMLLRDRKDKKIRRMESTINGYYEPTEEVRTDVRNWSLGLGCWADVGGDDLKAADRLIDVVTENYNEITVQLFGHPDTVFSPMQLMSLTYLAMDQYPGVDLYFTRAGDHMKVMERHEQRTKDVYKEGTEFNKAYLFTYYTLVAIDAGLAQNYRTLERVLLEECDPLAAEAMDQFNWSTGAVAEALGAWDVEAVRGAIQLYQEALSSNR